jgi:predicted nucleotidyltransferase
VDDQRRGGDIDLLVQPDPSYGNGGIKQKLQLHGELERKLGERKIDVIIEAPGDTRPVVQVAREQGVAL